MAVAYDRARFFSFVLHGSESNLTPVVASVLELGMVSGDEVSKHLAGAKLVTTEEAEDIQDGVLGDVNARNYIAIVDSLKGDAEPTSASLAVLTDVLSLVAIANRRFKKSYSWPKEDCDNLLAHCGTAVVEPIAAPSLEPAVELSVVEPKPAEVKPAPVKPAPAKPVVIHVAEAVAAVAEVKPAASLDDAAANQ